MVPLTGKVMLTMEGTNKQMNSKAALEFIRFCPKPHFKPLGAWATRCRTAFCTLEAARLYCRRPRHSRGTMVEEHPGTTWLSPAWTCGRNRRRRGTKPTHGQSQAQGQVAPARSNSRTWAHAWVVAVKGVARWHQLDLNVLKDTGKDERDDKDMTRS